MAASSRYTCLSAPASRRGGSSCGATLVEYVLVVPLLVLLLFAIIQLAHYWAVQGLINQGAQRGVSLAIRIADIEHDDPSDHQSYEKFRRAREKVLAEAESLPLAAFVRDYRDSPSAVHFIGFRNPAANAALLRPGECVRDNVDALHCHPTLCPASGECTSGAERRASGDSMAELLMKHPMVVVMPVHYRPFFSIPGMSRLNPSGVAAGYQEASKTGAFPMPADVELPPGSNDPDPVVTPVQTPQQPTPTPEPTPACPGDGSSLGCQFPTCPVCVNGVWDHCERCSGE